LEGEPIPEIGFSRT